MDKKVGKVKEKQVLYGFDYETFDFKIKSFLKLSPEQRLIEMFDFIEFVLEARKTRQEK